MTRARGFPAFPARPGRRGRSWWAREFVAALEDAALDGSTLRHGRRFAGRLGPISVAPGRVSAVADDPDGVVETVVDLPVLTDAEWDRFIEQVAAEAGHLAALLDGQLPRALVHAADAAGVALLPGIGELESDCDCPDVGDPCHHSAALCYQTAWLLDDDPLVLTLLRGRDRAALVDALDGRAPTGDQLRKAQRLGSQPTDRPVPAVDAYATPPPTLPTPVPRRRQEAAPAFPSAPDLDDAVLPAAVTGAMSRARVLLGL